MDSTPQTPPIGLPDLFKARIAVSLVFFLLGNNAGLWAVHIPVIKERLGVDPAVLGLALFTMAIGAIIAMPVAGWLVARFGSRVATTTGAIGCVAMTAPLIAAPTVPLFFVAAFLFGATMGGGDVSMNTQASEIEVLRRRPTMSSFHSSFSAGTLIGSLLGAGIIALGWGNGEGVAVVSLIGIAVAVYAAGNLLRNDQPAASGPRFTWPSRAVIGLGLIGFLCFAIEGAVGDWSALFLASAKQASPSVAASGFAMFSATMVIFRMIGDGVVERFGPRLTLTLGGVLVAVGMAVAVIVPWPIFGAVGFALVGVGAANVVPVVFSSAARTPGMSPSVALSAVTTLGYAGFLVAPPLLGFVAKASSLSMSLWLVALAGVVVAVMGAARK